MTQAAAAARRLQSVLHQLKGTSNQITESVRTCECGANERDWDPKELRNLIYGSDENYAVLQRVYNIFKDPIFEPQFGLSLKQERELCDARVRRIATAHIFRATDLLTSPEHYLLLLEAVSIGDGATSVRFGVHIGLFTACIMLLGTAAHHQLFADGITDYTMPGCFAMTELGAGSDLRRLETTAVYDRNTNEFILHTPTETAQKFLIGGSAETAKFAAVFARLIVDGTDHGVHVFVVRLRTEYGRLCPGVDIADVGPKVALNGLDNGRLWFSHVRLPHSALLDRFGGIGPDGIYRSSLPPSRRFLAHMSALLAARVNVGITSANQAKKGLIVTLRYAANRSAFGRRLIDMRAHQWRLLPRLAACYALSFFGRLCREVVLSANADASRQTEAHVLAAAIKTYASRFQNDTLQECREACGGQGFISANLVGVWRAEMDPHVTVDGDNWVLAQVVARAAVERASGDTDERPLLDARTLVPTVEISVDDLEKLFEYRDIRKSRQTAALLSRRMAEGIAMETAWDDAIEHVMAVATAFTEARIVKRFADVIRTIGERPIGGTLRRLLRLYCLRAIDSDMGWFAGNLAGYSAVWGSTAQDTIILLCEQLTTIDTVSRLLEGFGIPEQLYDSAPIAGDWIKAWSR